MSFCAQQWSPSPSRLSLSSGGDCDVNPKRGMCCREQYFIDFSSLTWTQYWIIEPAGYQAFRCTGGCKQPQRSHGYGERRCVVSESSTLPIMYLVKKEDHTEIEVAEFPNMIVEKCACMLDNVSLVWRLELLAWSSFNAFQRFVQNFLFSWTFRRRSLPSPSTCTFIYFVNKHL